jgi:hypothetical protein
VQNNENNAFLALAGVWGSAQHFVRGAAPLVEHIGAIAVFPAAGRESSLGKTRSINANLIDANLTVLSASGHAPLICAVNVEQRQHLHMSKVRTEICTGND